MTVIDVPERIELKGCTGLRLVADAVGPTAGPVALLLHGGGQTRQSWRAAQLRLAVNGWRAVAMDQRGHGESAWTPDKDYALRRYAEDIAAVGPRLWTGPPLLIGASLGGIASLLAAGERLVRARAVVLADVVHRADRSGAGAIRNFMLSASDGFESLDAAAEAVAAYLPHRARPASTEGLKRNLHLRNDGRWYWHWDPAAISHPAGGTGLRYAPADLEAAVCAIKVPILLVRGGASEIVSDVLAREFLSLNANAEEVVVPNATHMVSGDDNDAFANAIFSFAERRLTA